MSKVLTRQAHLFDAANTVFVGDGMPLHSALMRDMPDWINNLGTYCEPTFQFLMDASEGTGGALQTQWIKQSGESGSGSIFMGQFPLILPHDANTLRWTLGFERASNSPETAITMDVGYIHMYLCPEPLRSLRLGAGNDNHRFDSTLLKWWDARSIFVNITTNTIDYEYHLLDDTSPGWQNFMRNIPVKRAGDAIPLAWAVMVAEVGTAATGSSLTFRELSVWGDYS